MWYSWLLSSNIDARWSSGFEEWTLIPYLFVKQCLIWTAFCSMRSLDDIQDFWSDMITGRTFRSFSEVIICGFTRPSVGEGEWRGAESCYSTSTPPNMLSSVLVISAVIDFWYHWNFEFLQAYPQICSDDFFSRFLGCAWFHKIWFEYT